MSSAETIFVLHCAACDWKETCDIPGMLAWLRAHGSLKRAVDPEPATVIELFRSKREIFECPECDAELFIQEPVENDWLQSRQCETCGQPIPPARLDAIPTATNCAGCQEKIDRGEPTGEAEYCSRCGGIMVMAKSGSGLTRYVMRCSDCGR